MPADRPIERICDAWYQLWDNQHCCLAWSKEVFRKAEHTSASQCCCERLFSCVGLTLNVDNWWKVLRKKKTNHWNQHCKLFGLSTNCAFWNAITVLLTCWR